MTYRLFGVVEHSGSMNGGHYVSYVSKGGHVSDAESAWMYASDTHVSPATLQTALNAQGYLLFYTKV